MCVCVLVGLVLRGMFINKDATKNDTYTYVGSDNHTTNNINTTNNTLIIIY